ncbi:MAG: hypothetical protein O2894_10230 [Planctomycetota bacterium]|nr:hypothetical protein [Planctomycetota bacterium]
MPSPHRTPARRIPLVLGLGCALMFVLLIGCGEDPPAPPVSRAQYDADGRWLGPARAKPRSSTPNLVVLVIDTLRKDAVAAPGAPGGLMPFTTSLAKSGV